MSQGRSSANSQSMRRLSNSKDGSNLKRTGTRAELVQRVKDAITLGTLKIDGCSWYDAKSNLLNRSQPGSSTQTTAGKATTTTATKTVTTRTITNYLKWTTFPSIYIPNSFNEGIVYTFACKILPSAKMCPSF